MAEETPSTDMKALLFMQLVMSFQASAMQQMGKIKNPFTDKIERNLSQAQMSIEMLTMLQEKTKGNLTGDESRFIDHVLYELRMNYVDEVEKEKKAEVAEEKEEEIEEQANEVKEEIKTKKTEGKVEGNKGKKPSAGRRKKKADSKETTP